MLAKTNRLSKRKDFARVFKEGRTHKKDFLLLKIGKNNLETSRFGFIVSQKVSGKAVLRNKIKRRLREAIGSRLKILRKGADVVFIILPGFEKKNPKEMEKDVELVLKRAGLCEKEY